MSAGDEFLPLPSESCSGYPTVVLRQADFAAMCDRIDTLTAAAEKRERHVESLDIERKRLMGIRDTLTADRDELRAQISAVFPSPDQWELKIEAMRSAVVELAVLRTALVKWKHADDNALMAAKLMRDFPLLRAIPDDDWGLAPREEGKQP